MASKKEMRKEILGLRDSKSPQSLDISNQSIFNKVINRKEFKDANNIFIFVSYKSEVDTHSIIKHALLQGKKVCVPKVISKNEGMKAVYINDFSELKPTLPFGILEPTIDEYNVAKEEEIELAIIPGVAFDREGGRMGYGGGFYDRFLPLMKKECKRIGLCYSFQVIEKVIMEEYDEKVNCIITD